LCLVLSGWLWPQHWLKTTGACSVVPVPSLTYAPSSPWEKLQSFVNRRNTFVAEGAVVLVYLFIYLFI
jgi:hypothetical protein